MDRAFPSITPVLHYEENKLPEEQTDLFVWIRCRYWLSYPQEHLKTSDETISLLHISYC